MTLAKPILVTGIHRSGTTWMGRMLAQVPGIAYVHEPFNKNVRPGLCAAGFQCWYPYLDDTNGERYYRALADTLHLRYNLRAELRAIHSPKDVGRMVRDFARMERYRLSHARPLIKDPIALLSAEWLAARFQMDVIVLIRHPAGFASSLKQWNMSHPFSDFLQQERALQGPLAPFVAEIREFAAYEHELVDQAALLWKMLYTVIADYRQRHPDWVFVRQEDLAADPLAGFRELYARVGLPFTEAAQEGIRASSQTNKSLDKRMSIRRNSRETRYSWKKRLTTEEIDRIYAAVRDISPQFYGDDEW
jgi:hypothetical protein